MNTAGMEIEAKYYVKDLAPVRRRLLELGAQIVMPRILESNLRFDTPDGRLAALRKVLRLRKDATIRLTFKEPIQGSEQRREVELTVPDWQAGRMFLEALGFVVVASYEKLRTTYRLGPAEVDLDELPLGSFVEIEGPDIEAIRVTSSALGLSWERRIMATYLELFDRLCRRRNLHLSDLTFERFASLAPPLPEEIGVTSGLLDARG